MELSLFGLQKSNDEKYLGLDSVLMVEKFIKESDGEYRKKELWRNLPKKIMYPTFNLIIDYLLVSGKISVDAKGKIGWIYYPEIAKRYSKRKNLGRV